jgi:hypothetical protein
MLLLRHNNAGNPPSLQHYIWKKMDAIRSTKRIVNTSLSLGRFSFEKPGKRPAAANFSR